VTHDANNIGELWSKLINPKTRWIAELSVFSLCFGCCIFYSAFIGDIFGALCSSMGFTGIFAKRWVSLAVLSAGVLFPLCMLEDISALQFSSLLGVVGILYTVAFHVKRMFDNTYAPGSDILQTIATKLHPKWPSPKYTLWSANKGTLVLINMLCVAFLAHYNAITYYKELDRPTPARYTTAVTLGFGTALAVFVTMMMVGYTLFGSAAQPLILNNFHRSKDILATVARVATGAAITFAYPLMFAGVKTSLFNLMPASDGSADAKSQQKLMATAVLVAITSIAFKCGEEDVSLVLGIVGSVLGCGVAYVIPGNDNEPILEVYVMHICIGLLGMFSKRKLKREGRAISRADAVYDHLLVLLGTLFGVLGVWITLDTQQHHGGHH
jgi:amino acid permease